MKSAPPRSIWWGAERQASGALVGVLSRFLGGLFRRLLVGPRHPQSGVSCILSGLLGFLGFLSRSLVSRFRI